MKEIIERYSRFIAKKMDGDAGLGEEGWRAMGEKFLETREKPTVEEKYSKFLKYVEEQEINGTVDYFTVTWSDGALYGFIKHDVGMDIILIEQDGDLAHTYLDRASLDVLKKML